MKFDCIEQRVRRSATAGFTLAEVLVAIGGFGILMSALAVVFTSSARMERDIAAQFESQQGAMMIVGELKGHLREATRVELDAEGRSVMLLLPGGREVSYWHDAESRRVLRRIGDGGVRVLGSRKLPIESFCVRLEGHLALIEITAATGPERAPGVRQRLVLRTYAKSRNGAF